MAQAARDRVLARLAILARDGLPEDLREAIDAARAAGAPGDAIVAALAGEPDGDRVQVGRADDLPPGTVRRARAWGRRLAVGNAGGRLFAIDATCPHANGPLDQGELRDTTLTCPIHGFDFDVRSGTCLTDPRDSVETFDVEIEEGRVFVRRPSR